MYSRKKKNISGITLIELMVALGIMGIVMTTLYSLFTFSNRTLLRGERQYDIQSDMRIAMDSLVNNIRKATYVTLLSANESKAEIAEGLPYNYLYIDGNSMFYARFDNISNSHSVSKLAGRLVPDKSAFSRAKNDILRIELAAEYNGQTYPVSSEVLLVNLSLLGRKINGTERDKGIKFMTETGADLPTAEPAPAPTAVPGPAPSASPAPQPGSTPLPSPTPAATPQPGYPLWNASIDYLEGSYVLYNGAVYYTRYYANAGTVPGTMGSPWQELTDEWRHFNVYLPEDIVIYNGLRYKANWWNTGEAPDSSAAWSRLDN